MSWRMLAELGDAMAAADKDDDVRVVVITGAPPAFCAGTDMTADGHAWQAPTDRENLRRELQPHEVRKPMIAAINGHAIGVGLTYPLQCDVRFVATDAKLSFAFTRRGVAPELGSHFLLPRIVGFSHAADLLISGRTFDGSHAAAIGLASQALPADAVLTSALEYAHDIARNCSPTSCAIGKSCCGRRSISTRLRSAASSSHSSAGSVAATTRVKASCRGVSAARPAGPGHRRNDLSGGAPDHPIRKRRPLNWRSRPSEHPFSSS